MNVRGKAKAERFLALTGNPAAAYLVGLAYRAAGLADDIADGDSVDPPGDMSRLMMLMARDIPACAFAREYPEAVQHALAQAAATWGVSNRFHRSGHAGRETFGFVLRDGMNVFQMQIAAIFLGWEEAQRLYEAIWADCYETDPETVASWVGETVDGME